MEYISRVISGCCNNVDIVRREFVIKSDGLSFMVIITFCKSCGSKKHTSGISDGKK